MKRKRHWHADRAVPQARQHAGLGRADEQQAILARQTPDAEKRQRADFVIDTGQGLDHARQQVRDLLSRLRGLAPLAGDGEAAH